jgi:hypothetical protein
MNESTYSFGLFRQSQETALRGQINLRTHQPYSILWLLKYEIKGLQIVLFRFY